MVLIEIHRICRVLRRIIRIPFFNDGCTVYCRIQIHPISPILDNIRICRGDPFYLDGSACRDLSVIPSKNRVRQKKNYQSYFFQFKSSLYFFISLCAVLRFMWASLAKAEMLPLFLPNRARKYSLIEASIVFFLNSLHFSPFNFKVITTSLLSASKNVRSFEVSITALSSKVATRTASSSSSALGTWNIRTISENNECNRRKLSGDLSLSSKAINVSPRNFATIYFK